MWTPAVGGVPGGKESKMPYTIWRKPYGDKEWLFDGMQIDSEKLADQTFSMYHLAPGETIQLRDPDGFIIEERRDESRPFPD